MDAENIQPSNPKLTPESMAFLAQLSLLLNSSFDTKQVIALALRHAKREVNASAATVFLLGESTNELTFWALVGDDAQTLEGQKMPAGKGIVGWVIERRTPLFVPDASTDPRFFSEIDQKARFKTRDILCVPLIVRGKQTIGAIQLLNKVDGTFTDSDMYFTEQFAHQLALAIDNARLFSEVSERNQMLESLDRRKNEVISLIGHEFKTPLTVIQTAAELLSGGTLRDPSLVDKTCERLINCVSRLSGLMAQIRNISFVNRDDLGLRISRVNVNQLVEEMKLWFHQTVKGRELQLETIVDPKLPFVRGDGPLLLIVLHALVSNAIRFTPDGGKILLSAKPGLGLVEVCVTDTGIGIEPNEIPLIFQKFYEVHNIMQHSSGNYGFKSAGLGLGLATVQAILRAHGSSIEVSSNVGQGSTFRFSLPAS